jgi:NAD(P)-dependent dehydrogenase (short-subunit alcohol dehydrogenase family)
MAKFDAHPKRRPAIVTGASSGIGEAIAVSLARFGHPVVLAARRVDRLREIAAKIVADGGEAVSVPLDLTDEEDIDAFAVKVERDLGPIEILVSNAGEVLPADALEVDPDDFARQVQVNLLGAHRLVRAIGPAMVQRQRGDIVFVTSDVVRVPRPHMAAYMTSKHALEGLARAMQMELEGTGVRVGMVRPGPAATEQGSDWDPAVIQDLLKSWTDWGLMRHGGYLRPRDVAAAVLAVVTAPKGTHLTLVEVEPEAPIARRPRLGGPA